MTPNICSPIFYDATFLAFQNHRKESKTKMISETVLEVYQKNIYSTFVEIVVLVLLVLHIYS